MITSYRVKVDAYERDDSNIAPFVFFSYGKTNKIAFILIYDRIRMFLTRWMHNNVIFAYKLSG